MKKIKGSHHRDHGKEEYKIHDKNLKFVDDLISQYYGQEKRDMCTKQE